MYLQVSQLQGRRLIANAVPAIFSTGVVFTKKRESFPRRRKLDSKIYRHSSQHLLHATTAHSLLWCRARIQVLPQNIKAYL